jgi:magnesium transporter
MQLLSFRKPYEMLPPVPGADAHAWLRLSAGTFWRDIGVDEIDPVLAQDGTFVWVGLREPSASFLKKIQDKFALHALAVEDAHLAHQLPKVEVYGQSLFVVLHTIALVGSDLHVGELHLVVGRRFVFYLSRHHPRCGAVRQRCEEGPQPLAHGPGVLLYAIMDMIIDL